MSRNIGRADCRFCDGKVVHDEAPRPITHAEAGAYFPEYAGMLVARSRCRDCEAWVRGRPDWTWGHFARGPHDGVEHIDLSYLSTFNDACLSGSRTDAQ